MVFASPPSIPAWIRIHPDRKPFESLVIAGDSGKLKECRILMEVALPTHHLVGELYLWSCISIP